MRRTIALLAALVLVLGALAGCKPKDDASLLPAPSGEATMQISDNPKEPVTKPGTGGTEPRPLESGAPDAGVPAVIQIEGTEETVYYTSVTGSDGYVITMDVQRFAFEAGAEADVFRCLENENVSMSIAYFSDTTAAKLEEALLSIPGNAQEKFEAVKIADGKYEATKLHVAAGSQPESIITDDIIVAHDGGCYLITQVYFLEAAEGWGTRMYYMTEGFEIT